MKKLLLILPLLLLAADKPQEIEGWKVLMGTWTAEKHELICDQAPGMIESIKPISRVNLRLRVDQIGNPKFFRAGLFLGKTGTGWTDGTRIEVAISKGQVHITRWNYETGNRTVVVDSAPLKIRGKAWIPIRVRIQRNVVLVQIASARLRMVGTTNLSRAPWGLLANAGQVRFAIK